MFTIDEITNELEEVHQWQLAQENRRLAGRRAYQLVSCSCLHIEADTDFHPNSDPVIDKKV